MKAILPLIFVLALLPMAMPVHSQGQPELIIVNFDYQVNVGSSNMMNNVVQQAQAYHSKYVLIVMNSPGGYLSDMIIILNDISALNQSGIAVYTYVPPNALAASAASYIAMASNQIIMGPGSEIGPSTPIVVGGNELEQNHTEDAMLSLMQGEARAWGRNMTAAYNMVINDKAYSYSQALHYNIADKTASTLAQAQQELNLSGVPSITINENYYEQLLSVLSNTTLDGLLILLGMILIALDFIHPTIIMSIIGIFTLVLGLVGAEIIGASFIGIALLLISAALLIVEIKSGHGIAFFAAVIIGALGIYMLAQGILVSPSPYGIDTYAELAAVIAAGGLVALYVRRIIGSIREKDYVGVGALIGKEATAISELNPEGEVSLEGVKWKAVSNNGPIKNNSKVKVVSIRGLTLYVEPVDDENSKINQTG
ncbi:MAG: NfeD family protein [Conexivisphaerales archaeon]